MRAAPLLPARRLAQTASWPTPRGLTIPSPVTTTRRRLAMAPSATRLRGGLGQELDCVTKGLDGLGGVVGNLDAELFLERHHQFDLIERICAQVIDEAGLFRDLLGFDVEVLDNDLADAICDVAHYAFLLLRLTVFLVGGHAQEVHQQVSVSLVAVAEFTAEMRLRSRPTRM